MSRHRLSIRIEAALVHVFTGLGIVCALFAMREGIAGRVEQAFIWLGVALFIDGVDGYLARRVKVWEVLPKFSGETLDLVIDYVTYVFIPAMMFLEAKVLTGVWGNAVAAMICLSSLYHFCDEGSKSEDNCFVGFPAIWNIVAFYIFAFQPSAFWTYAILLFCIVMTFVRFKWVHPMRVIALRGLTLAATLAWAAAAAWTVWKGFPANGYAKATLIVVAVYGVALSIYFGRDGWSPFVSDE